MPNLANSLTLSHFIRSGFRISGHLLYLRLAIASFYLIFVCFQPTFVKALLLCLKAVHQSQSLYLLRILTESFLDSSHQSVVRMTERVIRRKLEMYTSGQKRVIYHF